MGLLTAYVTLKILPKLIRSLGLALLVAIAIFYIVQPQAIEAEQTIRKERFCAYVYKVTESEIPVCSTEKLSTLNVEAIEIRLSKSLELYPEFSSEYGEVKYTIPLTIYVVDSGIINDQTIFGSKFKKRVVGRYSERLGYVYITPEAFTSVGYTDLQHELAHYGNDNLGLSNDDVLDEKLANKFEKYYRRHVDK